MDDIEKQFSEICKRQTFLAVLMIFLFIITFILLSNHGDAIANIDRKVIGNWKCDLWKTESGLDSMNESALWNNRVEGLCDVSEDNEIVNCKSGSIYSCAERVLRRDVS